MSKIKQIYISQSLHQFWPFKDFYSLEDYNNIEEPALFFGLYNEDDIKVYQKHKGFKVLICGYPEYTKAIINRLDGESLNLLVYDEFEEYLAKSFRVKNYRLVRFAWQDISVCKPVPLGDKIYIHFGGHYKVDDLNFQKEKWVAEFGDNLIYPTEWTSYYDLVKDYYSKCFVNIITAAIPRRAEATAQSFGLMGINTLSKWPCLVPSYDIMPWWDSDELFKRIDIERKKIGTVQTELAQKCYDFFDFSDDWLYVDYWKE